jgi:hypothetical protein
MDGVDCAGNREKRIDGNPAMTLRLFTIVYGDRHLDWFERGLMKSLLWPNNSATLREKASVYDIWTTARDKPRAVAIAARLGIPVECHAIGDSGKAELFPALLGQMQLCKDNAFIFAAPDNVFGDGTIRTLVEVGSVKGICVSFIPLRVNETGFLAAMGDAPLSNAQLVKLGLARAHRGFNDACATTPQNNSFASGVSWRKLSEDMVAVTARCPSAYLMQPTARDIKWFMDKPKFGNYDHAFPRLLIESQRQRVIGSSDAAFTVEITREQEAIAPMAATDPAEPDKFIKQEPHYGVNRNTVCIWRAGDD